MKGYSIEEKRNGELAVRGLSEKAQNYYNGNEVGLVEVAGYKTGYEEGERRYAITGEGRDDEWLTLKEVEEYFEEMQDEVEAMMEDGE
jgi:hypothetical protein